MSIFLCCLMFLGLDSKWFFLKLSKRQCFETNWLDRIAVDSPMFLYDFASHTVWLKSNLRVRCQINGAHQFERMGIFWADRDKRCHQLNLVLEFAQTIPKKRALEPASLLNQLAIQQQREELDIVMSADHLQIRAKNEKNQQRFRKVFGIWEFDKKNFLTNVPDRGRA